MGAEARKDQDAGEDAKEEGGRGEGPSESPGLMTPTSTRAARSGGHGGEAGLEGEW